MVFFDNVDKVLQNFNAMGTRLENIREDKITQAEANEASIATLQLEANEYREEANRAAKVAGKIKELIS